MFAGVKRWIRHYGLGHGLLIRRVPAGRHGDPFDDQAALLAADKVTCVFDVGAYTGRTALRYHELFPAAQVHCFEPVAASFSALQRATSGNPRFVTNRVAVTDRTGELAVTVNRFAATSSSLGSASTSHQITGQDWLQAVATELVPAITLDDYCASRQISHINALKVDIQGGEAAALRGAADLLGRGAIDVVQFEILLQRLYADQPTASELLALMERYGYSLYGLYDFAFAVDTSIYQMDALFISPRIRTAPMQRATSGARTSKR